MIEFFQSTYLALLGCALTGLLSGLLSSVLYVKKQGSLVGSIAHSVLGAMALCLLLDLPPVLGAYLMAVFSALLLTRSHEHQVVHEDILHHLLWTGGISLGVILLSFHQGYPLDLLSLFLGNVFLIEKKEIWILAFLLLSTLLYFHLQYKNLVFSLFDPLYARTRNIPVSLVLSGFWILTSLSVVSMFQTSGMILVLALCTLPGAITRPWCNSLKSLAYASMGVSFGLSLLGFQLSYLLNLPTSSTIVLIYIFGLGLSLVLKKFFSKVSKN